jgi:hypothetical protein
MTRNASLPSLPQYDRARSTGDFPKYLAVVVLDSVPLYKVSFFVCFIVGAASPAAG